MLLKIFQFAFILLFPYWSAKIAKGSGLGKWLSPVVLCYGAGMVVGNLPFLQLDAAVSTQMTELSIVMAIPLLLFSTNLFKWLPYAGSSLLSFALCVISGLLATTLVAFLFRNQMEDGWMVSGMLVGIYTGGTPNMQAIGLALQADQEIIILLNGADIFCGGLFLIFLTSVAHSVFGRFLPDFDWSGGAQQLEELDLEQQIVWKDSLLAIGLTTIIIGASLGTTMLVFGDLSKTSFLILLLTTLSILATFLPQVQKWQGTFETGEYFLLMFCVALGMLADFAQIMAHGGDILLYTGLALSLTILLHTFMAYLFRIDRDTFMITSTAALYGPAFIGQIASVIGNKTLVLSGMVLGLLGYAIGNYLGISLAYLLQMLFYNQ